MGSTCLKAQSKDHPLGLRRCKEGWHSMILPHVCKGSEAVLFPFTEENCTTLPSKAAQAKKWVLVPSKRQLSFGLFLIFCCLNGLERHSSAGTCLHPHKELLDTLSWPAFNAEAPCAKETRVCRRSGDTLEQETPMCMCLVFRRPAQDFVKTV